jgi:CBS domain-containing protein
MLTTVRDLLRLKGSDIWQVSPDTLVINALNLMAEKKVGALLVVDGDQIAGIVSERDFVRKISENQTCELDRPVLEYMTRKVFTIHPSQTIQDCMQTMTDKHIRHLPVIEDDKIVGLISIGDVVKSIIDSQEFTIEQLQKYISGEAYSR